MIAPSKNSDSPIITKVAPFGYEWHNDSLVVNSAEAAARRRMYELFLEHRRKKTVARLLNEAGHRTRSGALFSDTAVDRLLRDSAATGAVKIIQNGKPKDVQIEPLIGVETWRHIGAILNDERKPLKQAVHLFAGLVFCECGGRMSVPSNSLKYVCAKCRRKIETQDLEEIFVRQLKAFPLAAFVDPEAEAAAQGIADTATLAELWRDLSPAERRLVAEQLTSRVEVGARRIAIEFAIGSTPIETAARGQQQPAKATERLVRASEQTSKKPQTVEIAPPRQAQAEAKTAAEPETAAQTPRTASEAAPTAVSPINEPLLNETEAAKFLGVSRMTLLRKRKAGEIKCFRVGFRVLYSKEQHLAPFLAKCESDARK